MRFDVVTKTRSGAFVAASNHAVIFVDGVGGFVALSHVFPLASVPSGAT